MITLQDWQSGAAYFTHKGHRIFYRQDGDRQKPALLLLHGFPTSSWDWHSMLPILRDHFFVICADFIGYGFSAKPFPYPYSTFDQADLIEHVLAHLNITRTHILAHDFGDTVAQELLARQMEGKLRCNIDSIALLNGGIFVEATRPLLLQKCLASPFGNLVVNLTSHNFFQRSMRRLFARQRPPSRAILDAYWQLLLHENGRRVLPYLIRYLHERRRYRERWVGALRATGLPLHAIIGDVDPVSGKSVIRRWRELLPHAGLTVLYGVGHYPQIEVPSEVWSAYLGFIQKILSSK